VDPPGHDVIEVIGKLVAGVLVALGTRIGASTPDAKDVAMSTEEVHRAVDGGRAVAC